MTAPEMRDVVCVVGITKDNKPVWKKVGVKMLTKSSKREVILLDRTFNPAGVVTDNNNKNSVALYFFEQDNKELRNKEASLKPEKQPGQRSYFEDFKDDIPF